MAMPCHGHEIILNSCHKMLKHQIKAHRIRPKCLIQINKSVKKVRDSPQGQITQVPRTVGIAIQWYAYVCVCICVWVSMRLVFFGVFGWIPMAPELRIAWSPMAPELRIAWSPMASELGIALKT